MRVSGLSSRGRGILAASLSLAVALGCALAPARVAVAEGAAAPGLHAQGSGGQAVATGTWGTCPWEIGADGTLTVHPGVGSPTEDDSPWHEWSEDIKAVRMVAEGGRKVVAPSDCSHLFFAFNNLKNADLSGLDTSSVTDMSEMFYECTSLPSLDISGWDTFSVTDMSFMFCGCELLPSLDVSGWDTSSVTDMSGMFDCCSSLRSLDVTKWDTSSVTNMSDMFSGCSSLPSLDVSGLDTSSVTDMREVFSGCSSLSSLDVSGLDTSSVADMSGMFDNCSSLTSLDVSSLCTSSVADMSGMFCNCSSLTSLDVSSLCTSSVTDTSFMFSCCSSLASLDLSGWDTSSVMNMSFMFSGCSSLTSLDLSGWDTSSVTDMSGMFGSVWFRDGTELYCSSLQSLDLSGWDTSSVTGMAHMFSGCSSLSSLDLSGWDTSSVTEMYGMFCGCSSLTSVDTSGWDTSSVTDMGELFAGCESLTELDLSGWDTSSVRGMYAVFCDCSSLASLDLSGWDTSQVDSYSYMFSGCALDEFRVGEGYRVSDAECVPQSSSKDGKWWSKAGQRWYTSDEIVSSRSGVADTYTATKKSEPSKKLDDILSSSSCDYNPELVAALARFSNAAYKETKLKEEYASWGISFEPHNYDNQYADSVAFAVGTAGLEDGRQAVVVTARGSWTGGDWANELLKTPRASTFGWHPSFESCARDVYATLSGKGNLKDDNKVYVLCGHSRGAAAMNLLAVLLSDAGVPRENVYCCCFGCPDVAHGVVGLWNPGLKHDNIFNIARASDIVSVIPGTPGDTLISKHLPGILWGKYGRSYWFADDWGDWEETDLCAAGHSSAKDVEYFGKLPPLERARSFAGAEAAWALRRMGKTATSIYNGLWLLFCCPVDVTVKDGSGKPVAAVVGGEPQYFDSEPGRVLIAVEGDAKEFLLPEGDYSIEVEATGDGLMDCSLEHVVEGSVVSSSSYESVVLDEGKEMSADVVGDRPESTRLLVLGEDGRPVAEVLSDGEEVPLTVVFSDVTGSTAHAGDIAWLAASGISAGWDMPDGTKQFRPYNKVTRADMAAFLFRLARLWGLVDESWQPDGGGPSFRDVSPKTAHYREVMWLAESGISEGWKVGGGREFRPYANVARADMAAFLFRLARKAGMADESWQPDGGGPSFRDVSPKTAHYREVMWLAESGVSEGWKVAGGRKEFRPYANVARADMAAFLHRLDGLR